MAGDNPYEAFDRFRRPIQRAISCVSRDAHVWVLGGEDGYTPGRDYALVPERGEPVGLSGPRNLSLTSLIAYRIVRAKGERGPYEVQTTAYYHALLDEDGREIVAYHWHPRGESEVLFPHMHIGAGIGADLGELHNSHFPTGLISLEEVLRLAVEEFGAEPKREDWREVLGRTQADYERWRT